mmetsp:Transcript_48470/g.127982  ORF Transcript_48470/g.127982 Transcript_48470/m.127982 type:complete len:269 (+) Transcript_48470:95-901(+)
MSPATFLLAALALASSAAASQPLPDTAIAAALADELCDEVCEASDVECALSLRQLRATTVLAPDIPEAAKPGASAAMLAVPTKGAPVDDKALKTLTNRHPLSPTSLMETLQRKGGAAPPSSGSGWHPHHASSTNVKTLYHMTSPMICRMILTSGFRAGSEGWCGGAIYFAEDPAAVKTKAIGTQSHWGCLLEVYVDLGKVLQLGPQCDKSMTGAKLAAMGYNSITFNPGDGNEYIIYDTSRVLGSKVYWRAPAVPDGSNELSPNRIRA